MPCGISWPRLIIGALCLTIVGFLGYWIICVPAYRFPALTLVFEILFFALRLWRFLPWERLYWEGLGKELAIQRVGGKENFHILRRAGAMAPVPTGDRVSAEPIV